MKTEINLNLEDFIWLQNWYYSYCDGDWEHDARIKTTTINNKEWSFTVNLMNTNLQEKEFEPVSLHKSETDWIFCEISGNMFEGHCSPTNLPEILYIFRTWAESLFKSGTVMKSDDFNWIQQWYFSQRVNDFENKKEIHLSTIDNPGWYLRINLKNTNLENKPFDNIIIERSEDDWIHCLNRENIFEGAGGPLNLLEILKFFREWAES